MERRARAAAGIVPGGTEEGLLVLVGHRVASHTCVLISALGRTAWWPRWLLSECPTASNIPDGASWRGGSAAHRALGQEAVEIGRCDVWVVSAAGSPTEARGVPSPSPRPLRAFLRRSARVHAGAAGRIRSTRRACARPAAFRRTGRIGVERGLGQRCTFVSRDGELSRLLCEYGPLTEPK